MAIDMYDKGCGGVKRVVLDVPLGNVEIKTM
jgi:hypothetical protein